jgi:hypothetical protein
MTQKNMDRSRKQMEDSLDFTSQYAEQAMKKRHDSGIPVGHFMANGASKDIHEHPDNPELVRCVFRRGDAPETKEDIEGRYLLTKLLHLLYPEQIPDMTAYSVPEHILEEYWIDVQRIHIDESRRDEIKNSLPERHVIINSLDELGVGLDTGNHGNFAFDTAGKLWYVDSIDPWGNRGLAELKRNYNPQALLDRIQTLPETEKSSAIKYVNRLEDLFKIEADKK